jgi:hypothetical protein
MMSDQISVQTHYAPVGGSPLGMVNAIVSLYKDFGWSVDVQVAETVITIVTIKNNGKKKIDRVYYYC